MNIVSWLPAHDTRSIAAVNAYCAATVCCEFIWFGHLEEEQERHPNVSVPNIEGVNAAQLYWSFRRAAEASLAREVLSVAEEYRQNPCPFSALRRVVGDAGTLEGGGTAEARFIKDFDLPQPAVVALELIKFFGKVPGSEKGAVVGDKYERVAAVFGCSHQAIRDLEKRIVALRLKLVLQAQALAAPFPDAAMQMRVAGGGTTTHLILRLQTPRGQEAKVAQRELARLKPAHAQLETRYYKSLHQMAASKQQEQANERAALLLARARAASLQDIADAATTSDQASAVQLRVAQRRLAVAQKVAEDTAGKRARQAALIARVRKQRDDAVTEQQRSEAVQQQLQVALLEAKQTIAAQKRKLAEQQQQIETQANVAGAAALQLQRERDARLAAEQLASTNMAAFKVLYRKESLQQRKDKNMSPNKVAIAADYIATLQPGAIVRIFSGSGPGYTLQRIWHARKGSADLQKVQLRTRSKSINSMVINTAGGEEHIVAQLSEPQTVLGARYDNTLQI